MAYKKRAYKKGYKSPDKGMKKMVKKEIKAVLGNELEQKETILFVANQGIQNTASISASGSSTFGLIDLFPNLTNGSITPNQFIGDEIMIRNLRFRLHLRSSAHGIINDADEYNNVRVIVFQWRGDCGLDPPTTGQVLDESLVSAGAEWNCLQNQTFRDKCHILYDKTIVLANTPVHNGATTFTLGTDVHWEVGPGALKNLDVTLKGYARKIHYTNSNNIKFKTSTSGSTENPMLGAFRTSSSPNYTFPNDTTGQSSVGTLRFGSESGLYADLSAATAATINQLRQSFQIQKLLERDARGGTRYTEIIRSHFGVISPDARLQRPEYLGGGSTPININPIAQTSASAASGTNTPLGTLGSMGTALAHNHGFTQSFVEHGIIIGLVSIRADLTYQQGLSRMWSRETRYDFYFPAFAMLGEQAVLNKEIYVTGNDTDDNVFGYQERWAEYRYYPSRISGLFRSTAAGTIDAWHLAQKFTTLPTLNDTFISDTPPVDRIVAVGSAANGKQFIFDSFFDVKKARPLPMYSVPGLIDHF